MNTIKILLIVVLNLVIKEVRQTVQSITVTGKQNLLVILIYVGVMIGALMKTKLKLVGKALPFQLVFYGSLSNDVDIEFLDPKS